MERKEKKRERQSGRRRRVEWGRPGQFALGGPGSAAAKSRINHEAVVLCRPSLSPLSLSLSLLSPSVCRHAPCISLIWLARVWCGEVVSFLDEGQFAIKSLLTECLWVCYRCKICRMNVCMYV